MSVYVNVYVHVYVCVRVWCVSVEACMRECGVCVRVCQGVSVCVPGGQTKAIQITTLYLKVLQVILTA